MLDVSAQWHNASRQQFRHQAYLSVKLEVAPPGIRQGASVQSSDTFSRSSESTIVDGLSEVSKGYVSLETNRWLLNGTYDILDTQGLEKTSDWWSSNSVSQDSKPTISFTFDKTYSIPGMFITWDSVNYTHPDAITVYGYDAEGSLKYTVVVEHITSYQGFYDAAAMDDVKSITIIVDKWSLDTWRARIDEVIFGLIVSFDSVNNGRIMSATQTSKADPLGRKLPTHNLEIELRNYDQYFDPSLQDGISKYLAQQQVLKAQWMFTVDSGVVESAPEQVYLTENFNIDEDSKTVRMSLTSRIELLDNEFKLGNYTGTARTLRAIVDYVLSNSNILKESDSQQPWIVPDTFDSIYTYAPIPAMAVNAIMQLVALAGCTWLTTSGTDGFVKFAQPFSEPSSYCEVSPSQELGDPEIAINDRLKSVSVGVYHYTVASATTEIGRAEYDLLETQTLVVKYSKEYASNVSATVSNGTLVSATYYASYAILTISPASSGATVTVVLNGKAIDYTVSYIETYRNSLISDGMDVTVDNMLITDVAHAQQVAEYVKNYYIRRNQYKIAYTGYPQAEPVDCINFSTVYGSSVVEITSNTIKFNGGWSGDMEVT